MSGYTFLQWVAHEVLLSFGTLKSWNSVNLALGCFRCAVGLSLWRTIFEWGLIGVYGPNDDFMRWALFEELSFFVFLGHSVVFG